MKPHTLEKPFTHSRAAVISTAALAAAAATAAWVQSKARRAERDHPPVGRFVEVDGVRLHYVERGSGPTVLLIHGNMVTGEDFEASGLIDRLAATHHVVAFDRPGFGHSTRPRDRLWTPAAQAALLHAALARIGVARPVVVLGHSMGALVALALALDHAQSVRGLVLLGGYYYPTVRVDALLTAPVALPVLGDVLRYTVTALGARASIDRLVQGMFAPQPVPAEFFDVVSREMMLRPVQLRANAEDAAFMIPAAAACAKRCAELAMPVALMAGQDDLVVDAEDHTLRLHDELPASAVRIVRGTGHMVHYRAGDDIAAAIAAMGEVDQTGPGRRFATD